MLTPVLTLADPAESTEGTIDPLGLYSIAESLASRLAPGVRERQSNPRFLTAMAVSAVVVSGMEDEIKSSKDVENEPWQVFEWYLVEGIVRTVEDIEVTGLPGINKAREAIRNDLGLSRDRYLVTPTVFGFHGVYRALAEALNIIDKDGELKEAGVELIGQWEKEPGLKGFYCGNDGSGSDMRKMLVKAVIDGIHAGETSRSKSWNGWEFFRDHLFHMDLRKKNVAEAKFLRKTLTKSDPNLNQIIDYIASREGQELLEEGWQEAKFYRVLKKTASDYLKDLIDAIASYEKFSRLLQDAFDECRVILTRRKGKTKIKELADSKAVKRAAQSIPELFNTTEDLLKPFGRAESFEYLFEPFREQVDPAGFARVLVAHHEKIQKNKPPAGKASWFIRFTDEDICIRGGYFLHEYDSEAFQGSYVHPYRTRPLNAFLLNLGVIKG